MKRTSTWLRMCTLASSGMISCLPADDRPPPGSLLMTVSPSPAVKSGTTTKDGWGLSFDRVVVGIGRASLGKDCVSYSEARYDRVLDVTQGDGQKLSTLFGLGTCDLEFQISAPSFDALLGEGVTEDTKTLMRTPVDDAFVAGAGIALLVEGSASSGGVEKTFRWQFRQTYSYDTCTVEINGAPVAGVTLRGNVALTYDIAIAPERLLLDDIADTAELRFDPFAAADGAAGAADGEVTLPELAQVELGQLRGTAPYSVAGKDPGDAVKTLQDWAYLVLFPRVARFRDDGTCNPQVGGRHHHD